MKRHPDETREEAREVRFWTHEEARKAVPYIRSVMHSVREHYLAAQAEDERARKLASQHGRPDRTALIAQNEVNRRRDDAQDRLADAVEELEEIDVFCIDPAGGEAVIPCLHGDQPAWFVFDLFADQPLTQWRYHTDSVETYRPLAEMTDGLRIV